MTESKVKPLKLAVLISGGGSTLENLAQCIEANTLNASIELVISTRADVKGVERAQNRNLKTEIIPRKGYDNPEAFSDVVFDTIRKSDAELVCLAGFLSLLVIPSDFHQRIINIHPSLLPSFGGKGMFGHHVHQAVLNHGCKVSGCTVHFADATYDTGPIIAQQACKVLPNDTPESLAARVGETERQTYPSAINKLATNPDWRDQIQLLMKSEDKIE